MLIPTVYCEINFSKVKNEEHTAKMLLIQENAEITLNDGKPFTFIPAVLERMAKNSNTQNRHDVVVDYFHNTFSEGGGYEEKQAAGWLKQGSFEYVPGLGLTALVSFTDTAKELIEQKKLRYVSPVMPDPNNEDAYIVNAALTNNPRINFSIDPIMALEMGIVKNTKKDEKKEVFCMSKIAKLLGLPEAATEEQISEAVLKLQKSNMTVDGLMEQAASLLKCQPNELLQQVQTLQTAQTKVLELEKEKAETQITAALDKAQTAGKITKAEREKWAGYLRKGKEFFEILEELPVKVELGQRGKSVNMDMERSRENEGLSVYEAEKASLTKCYDAEQGQVKFLRFDMDFQARQLMEKDAKLSYRDALTLIEKSGILQTKGASA